MSAARRLSPTLDCLPVNQKEGIMRLRLLQIGLVLMLAAIPAWAQTSVDLNSKYGAPQQSYEIRPGIFTTVKHNADGQVCEMSVEKRHIQASGTINIEPTVVLSADELKEITEELAPTNQRGAKSKPFGLLSISGVGGTEMDEYENVYITYYFKASSSKKAIVNNGTAATVITWKNRSCESK